ncbi:nucleoside phosphatase family-domain-containing protein [Tribonema minus]|uniref:Nucleoside phosphatase family-domain-containing protein n=1 Tax=Tribonema minus TaxID=303371 RepID=A0A835Z3X5_9STRA|nr:nucleoside phosphatase family-domain-containing protein [Tribonema minus]
MVAWLLVQLTGCLLPLLVAAAHTSTLLDTTHINHGLLIDAGSGGSRLHVYRWKKRIFETLPPSVSHPLSHNSWTARLRPGISSFADDPEGVGESLQVLIDFAKEQLKKHKEDWHKMPIALGATAGMRQLPPAKRRAVMAAIRDYLHGPNCPFYFEDYFARVISGEEEGIFAWAGINFLRGNLLLESEGAGLAVSHETVGALDMGGASAQIAFFRSDQDIMSNLFKLQVGAQKHWNVYVHSFLYFGEAAMRLRLLQSLVDAYNGLHAHERSMLALGSLRAGAPPPNAVRMCEEDTGVCVPFAQHPLDRRTRNRFLRGSGDDGDDVDAEGPDVVGPAATANTTGLPHISIPCLPAGATGVFPAADGVMYAMTHQDMDASVRFDACREAILPLLNKHLNAWCEYAYNGECSMGGIYQPELPAAANRVFYAFSGFRRAFDMMNLPSERLTLAQYREGAREVCSLDMQALLDRNERAGKPLLPNLVRAACYTVTYMVTLLADGYGFKDDFELNVVAKIDGYKVGWPLGAMLYAINTLPWEYSGTAEGHHKKKRGSSKAALAVRGGASKEDGTVFGQLCTSALAIAMAVAAAAIGVAYGRRTSPHGYSAIGGLARAS